MRHPRARSTCHGPERPRGPRRRALVLAGLVVAVLIAGLGALFVGGDPDESPRPNRGRHDRPTDDRGDGGAHDGGRRAAAVRHVADDHGSRRSNDHVQRPPLTTTAPPVVPPPAYARSAAPP